MRPAAPPAPARNASEVFREAPRGLSVAAHSALPAARSQQEDAAPAAQAGRRPGSGRSPMPAAITLLAALCLHIAFRLTADGTSQAEPHDLPRAPAMEALLLASAGEPEAASKALMLHLQAYDDQPGAPLPWREMDYNKLQTWLARALDLDPRSQYPLMAATEIYSAVNDQQRISQMLDFVHQRFAEDPNRRWPWLAHAALIAQHRLHDPQRAQQYAAELSSKAPQAPPWARQLGALLAQENELQATRQLAGAMLATGQIHSERELRELERILQATESRAAAQDGALR
jgi:hypothetical protein